MAESESVKMSIVRIAQILQSESDREHPLSQQRILTLLAERFGMKLNRKTVRRNLEQLRAGGLPVLCREVDRETDGRPAPLTLDWYWDHEFTKEELSAVIDALYFSRLPLTQVRALEEKLKKYYGPGEEIRERVRNLPETSRFPGREEILRTLEKAMTERKKITFYLDHYEADRKRHHNRFGGREYLYTVSPWFLIAADGRYFLAGSEDGHEEPSVFAADLISSLEITSDAAVLPKPAEGGVRTGDFLFAWRHFAGGLPVVCAFEADSRMMTQIIGDFGEAARLTGATGRRVSVEIRIQPEALKAWALAYSPHVKITAPASLVRDFRDAAAGIAKYYGG